MPEYVDTPSDLRSYLISLPGRVFGPVLESRTWLSVAYLLLSLVTGVAYFTIAAVGISVSAGLAVLVVGLPFLVGFLGLVRLLSMAERWLVELLLGVHLSRPITVRAPEAGLVARALASLKDRRNYRTLLYLLLQGPLGILYFTLVVVGLAVSVWLMAAPVIDPFVKRSWLVPDSGPILVPEPWMLPLLFLTGLGLFLATLHGARALAHSHATYARRLLVGREPERAPAD
jgi:hypothetical protein